MYLNSYPCKNCTKRHLACWDTCDTYQAYSIKIHAQKDLQKELEIKLEAIKQNMDGGFKNE